MDAERPWVAGPVPGGDHVAKPQLSHGNIHRKRVQHVEVAQSFKSHTAKACASDRWPSNPIWAAKLRTGGGEGGYQDSESKRTMTYHKPPTIKECVSPVVSPQSTTRHCIATKMIGGTMGGPKPELQPVVIQR